MSKNRNLKIAFYHPSMKFLACPEHICVADENIRDAEGNPGMVALFGPSEFSGATPELLAETMAEARLFIASPELLRYCRGAYHALRSYQFGNSSPDLAKDLADKLQALLEPLLTELQEVDPLISLTPSGRQEQAK